MNSLDFFIIVFLVISLVLGLKRGFIREIFSLLSLVAGFFLAVSQMHHLVSLASRFIHIGPTFLTIFSFVLIFIVGYVVTNLIGMLLSKLMHVVFMAWLDHLGGSVFGLLKGCLLASIIIYLAALLPLNSGYFTACEKSKIIPYIKPIAPTVFNTAKVCFPGIPDFYEEFKAALSRNCPSELSQLAEKWDIKRFLDFAGPAKK